MTCGSPHLYRRITLPDELLAGGGQDLRYGGDLRVGDLTGNQRADLVFYRAAANSAKPVFAAACDMEGRVLWQQGAGGDQPVRPGPVAVHDVNGDGRTEVVCLWADPRAAPDPGGMGDALIQLRDGTTGRVLHQAAPSQLRACRGEGPNWVHQRLLVANLRGLPTPRDLVIKLGETVLALDDRFNVLWTYRIPWNEYGRCASYIPAVGDIDGDGRDEVLGGYYLLNWDGAPLWEKQLAPHMDSVAIVPWDGGHCRAICSGGGHVLDHHGRALVALGQERVPHGQEVRVGFFSGAHPGTQLILRYRGHTPDLMLVDNRGAVVARYQVNPSPNNTGMEVVQWGGPNAPALLYNGGMLWHGDGRPFAALPGLPPPCGPSRMGWYHCIAGDFCGDERQEVLLYNPWDRFVTLYTPAPLDENAYAGYSPGPSQINPRLMD